MTNVVPISLVEPTDDQQYLLGSVGPYGGTATYITND